MSKLNEFARWVLDQSFEGGDIDGVNAQEKAHELGLLKKVSFDPDVHIDMQEFIELETGDEIYLYTDKLESKEV